MRLLIIGIFFTLTFTATVAAQELPEQIRISGANRSPEGLECDVANQRFLLSSLAEGTVYAVDYAGAAAPFIEDEDLISSVGLEIDQQNDRLLVVNASFEHPETASLGIYEFSTGTRLEMIDLAALAPDYSHFPNDVTVAPDGTIYITDSLAPVIYQVDADGEASLLLEHDDLLIEGFGGNGIAYHPDAYLLVGISGVELYKIPLGNPEDFTIVETPITVAADGMLWDTNNDDGIEDDSSEDDTADGSLIVVNEGEVLRLVSDDDWASAEVAASASNHPATTAAFCDEAVYVIHPQRNRIVRVNFRE